MFGYEKGAFTGVHKRTKGKFETASGGTLFLDEIGDMKLDVHAKLLKILETREFERIGGTKIIKTDVMIIAAINKNLEEMVDEKLFREDLFYRISVFPVHIPPLRERKQDIPKLSNHHIILNESQEKIFKQINMDRLVQMIINDHGLSLDDFESYCINHAIKTSNSNVSRAARFLGLSRATLRYRLKKINE